MTTARSWRKSPCNVRVASARAERDLREDGAEACRRVEKFPTSPRRGKRSAAPDLLRELRSDPGRRCACPGVGETALYFRSTKLLPQRREFLPCRVGKRRP